MQELLAKRGPATRPRASYNKTGIGQHKQIKGNPISWGIDCLGRCWPFMTLRGGQDATSQAVRATTAKNLLTPQPYLASRGVIGVTEEAGGSGGLPQSYNADTPTATPATGGGGSSEAPGGSSAGQGAPTCPEGLVYIQLGGGKYKCAVPFGRK